MATSTKPLYYCVHIATRVPSRRGSSLMWSRAFDTPGEAKRHGADRIATGDASLTFVVQALDDEWTILETYTRPTSAAKIIQHFLDVEEVLEKKERGE